MKANRQVMPRSLILFPCSLFCFMKVMTIVCREKARIHVPACAADPEENHYISSIEIDPSAALTMNWMITKIAQMKIDAEPYQLSFTSKVMFLRNATAKRGTNSSSDSHCALNLLKTKLSFMAMEEGEPAMSTMRQMMEQNWSTMRSTVMMLSRTRQSPVMKRKMSSHFLPRILLMVHSISFSSSEEWRTQMRQVMKEMMAEIRSTMVPLATPESLKMRGRLRIAGPSMLLNIARMVEMDEFFGQNPDMIKLIDYKSFQPTTIDPDHQTTYILATLQQIFYQG